MLARLRPRVDQGQIWSYGGRIPYCVLSWLQYHCGGIWKVPSIRLDEVHAYLAFFTREKRFRHQQIKILPAKRPSNQKVDWRGHDLRIPPHSELLHHGVQVSRAPPLLPARLVHQVTGPRAYDPWNRGLGWSIFPCHAERLGDQLVWRVSPRFEIKWRRILYHTWYHFYHTLPSLNLHGQKDNDHWPGCSSRQWPWKRPFVRPQHLYHRRL